MKLVNIFAYHLQEASPLTLFAFINFSCSSMSLLSIILFPPRF